MTRPQRPTGYRLDLPLSSQPVGEAVRTTRDAIDDLLHTGMDVLICDGVEFERMSRSYGDHRGTPTANILVDGRRAFVVMIVRAKFEGSDVFDVTLEGRFYDDWSRLNG